MKNNNLDELDYLAKKEVFITVLMASFIALATFGIPLYIYFNPSSGCNHVRATQAEEKSCLVRSLNARWGRESPEYCKWKCQ